MLSLTEEQLAGLLEAGRDWNKINETLNTLKRDELIQLLDALNGVIELIEINEYARMQKEDD